MNRQLTLVVTTAVERRGPKRRCLSLNNSHSEADDHRPAGPSAFRLARILLVAALFGGPLAFGAVLPWAWASLGFLAALALFLWALGCVQQGVLRVTWSPVFTPLALFFVIAIALYGAGHTLDWSETRQALILLAEDLIFYFLAVQLFSEAGGESLRAFGLAVLVFGGCLGLFTILQFASGTHRIYGLVDTPTGGLFGPYVNRDHFSGLMEMVIPVAILYIAGRRTTGALADSALLVFAATLAVASILLSGSRGGLMALTAEIAIAVLAFRRTLARSLEGRRLAVATLMALVMGVTLFAYVDEGGSAKKLGSVASVDRTWADWAGERKSMALDTLRMWRDHPILGVGLGDFEIAYPRYQSFPNDAYIDHAHNDYIEAAAETGLVGVLLILWALARFSLLTFRDWSQPVQSQAAWIRLGAAIGCYGLLVHSLWDFNLRIPANAAWFAVLAGIATAGRESQ